MSFHDNVTIVKLYQEPPLLDEHTVLPLCTEIIANDCTTLEDVDQFIHKTLVKKLYT